MDYSLLVGVKTCEYAVSADGTTAAPAEKGTSLRSIPMESDTSSFRTVTANYVHGPTLYQFGLIDILQQW